MAFEEAQRSRQQSRLANPATQVVRSEAGQRCRGSSHQQGRGRSGVGIEQGFPGNQHTPDLPDPAVCAQSVHPSPTEGST